MNSIIRALEELESLDITMDFHLQVDLNIQSLPKSFKQTIANFYMKKIECTLANLLNMLIMPQKAFQGSKGKYFALIIAFTGTKKKGNKKKKGKISVVNPTSGIAKNKGNTIVTEGKGKCFNYLDKGH